MNMKVAAPTATIHIKLEYVHNSINRVYTYNIYKIDMTQIHGDIHRSMGSRKKDVTPLLTYVFLALTHRDDPH